MKGLIIWAWSECRSAMATYKAIKEQVGVPCEIAMWHYRALETGPDMREKVGFSGKEFSDVVSIPIGEDYERGLQVLDSHPGWNHLFCVYQSSPVFRALLLEAKRRGERVAVMSEAPCEMYSGMKAMLHGLYMRFILPLKLKRVISASSFFVNYSGDQSDLAKVIGWKSNKIVPFGYYPPPIEGTKCVERGDQDVFTILSTGILSKYRGADVLVEALRILKERGISYQAIITQDGELLPKLKQMADVYDLPITFTGFMPMEEMKLAYSRCSVYVAAGRSEPWGMRLNDALNCGAPLIVSKGMGGVKLIDMYECGESFKSEDAKGLADSIERMARDKNLYKKYARNAVRASKLINPICKARSLLLELREAYPDWWS